MCQLYNDDNTEAVLLVDTFNLLNQQAALHNIKVLCPSIATILAHTYGGAADLFVGGEVLSSQEGTIQGDSLAMCMYAIGILALICSLQSSGIKQVWYADDATGGGTLEDVKNWWDHLISSGQSYGYHPNAAKSWLVVKETMREEAASLSDEHL